MKSASTGPGSSESQRDGKAKPATIDRRAQRSSIGTSPPVTWPDADGADPQGTPPLSETSAFPLDAPTSEADWIHLVAQAPELAISTRPVLVVSPHPDDESLAVGGLLAELASRDVSVTVLTVTDGEGSHPGRAGLTDVRATEQAAALRALGLDDPPVRLGLPDGSVSEHTEQLANALADRCHPDTVVLAPWEHDGHTDHDACGAVAHEVAAAQGATLLAYPVWAWQWASIGDLEQLALRRTTLSESSRSAKARAMACYSSQVFDEAGPPIVGPAALARFLRPWEVLIDVR